jgi:SAM-dependent methyltransferase
MPTEPHADAPRLIEWTGERAVPWAPDAPIAYEHFHRYMWAAQLVSGRRVLDLGSGEGYGSAILAERAAHVLGIDVDDATVEHSRNRYAGEAVDFRVGSAVELGDLADGSLDAVVAFELIEHLEDHERMLAGIARVLAPDGILIISTPDTRVYSQERGHENPFHVRELDEPEFRALLGAHFTDVRLWGQRTIAGSRIAALDAPASANTLSVFIEREGEEWTPSGEPTPMYLVAVASRAAFAAPPGESTLIDVGALEMLEEKERAIGTALGERDAALGHVAVLQSEVAAVKANAAEGWERYHTLRERRVVRMALAAVDVANRLPLRRR